MKQRKNTNDSCMKLWPSRSYNPNMAIYLPCSFLIFTFFCAFYKTPQGEIFSKSATHSIFVVKNVFGWTICIAININFAAT